MVIAMIAAIRDLDPTKEFAMRLINLGIVMGCLVSAQISYAGSGDEAHCRQIRAEIDLTHGTIEGNFGLDGTVAFAQDSAGTAPATAPATSSVFSGLLTIATARGDLVLRETGMFSSRTGNPAGSVLMSWGDTQSGTGRFAGVTGALYFTGRVGGSIFVVDVAGELCRPQG